MRDALPTRVPKYKFPGYHPVTGKPLEFEVDVRSHERRCASGKVTIVRAHKRGPKGKEREKVIKVIQAGASKNAPDLAPWAPSLKVSNRFMKGKVLIDKSGLAVIPKQAREALGVQPGDTLDTFVASDAIILVALHETRLAFAKSEGFGSFGAAQS